MTEDDETLAPLRTIIVMVVGVAVGVLIAASFGPL
jgi:hypothetical protein